jgi:hypothetical protein
VNESECAAELIKLKSKKPLSILNISPILT